MPGYTIEVEAFEAIVRGGVRRVTWLVEQDGEWRMASELPGASVEARDAGPGTVWVRRVTLQLPPGARLLRIESAPRHAAPRDPLSYLFEPERQGGRQTRRNQFVVGQTGRLERARDRR